MKYSARSKRLSGINVYMTNTSTDIVPMGQVHDWYSLRWQIESLFKTWKTDCHSTLFFHHVSNAAITSYETETRTE